MCTISVTPDDQPEARGVQHRPATADVLVARHLELRRSRQLLALLGVLVAIAVSSGSFNSVDTVRRYQVTRWLWAGEPQVITTNDPDFGVYGRGGERFAWYGIGQSLIMLPFDLAGSAGVSVLTNIRDLDDDLRKRVRIGVVAVCLSALTASVAVVAAFELLVCIGFTIVSAKRGAVAFLFCTTFLTYTQTVMENNLIVALTLCAAVLILKGLDVRSKRYFVVAGACMGFNLLVRLTTLLDVSALVLFAVLIIGCHDSRLLHQRATLVRLSITLGATLACFLAIERIYHYIRFEGVTGTYIGLWGKQMRVLNPALPPSFPFTTPFWAGFLGAWVSPLRSVLIYDPLLAVSIVAVVCSWRRLSPCSRAYFAAMSCLLIAYVSFYATYYDWGGTTFWGDRFVVGPVQGLSLLAVPLLSEGLAFSLRRLGPIVLRVAASLALAVQISSVFFSVNLEMGRMISANTFSCILLERWTNIALWASGRTVGAGMPDRFSIPNIFPFVIAAQGQDSLFIPLMVLWLAVLSSVVVVVNLLLRQSTRRPTEVSAAM